MEKEVGIRQTDNPDCVVEPAEYEILTRDVLTPFIKGIVGKAEAVGCGSRNQVSGRSGFSHQIDISIRAAERMTLVECKCWNNEIPVGRVLEFAARIIDISEKQGNVRGMMVTTKGYQSGAKLVADYFKISLSIVKNVSEFILRYDGSLGLGVVDALSLSDSFQYELGIAKH